MKKLKTEKMRQREAISRIMNVALQGTRFKVISNHKDGSFDLVITHLTLKALWRTLEFFVRHGIF